MTKDIFQCLLLREIKLSHLFYKIFDICQSAVSMKTKKVLNRIESLKLYEILQRNLIDIKALTDKRYK